MFASMASWEHLPGQIQQYILKKLLSGEMGMRHKIGRGSLGIRELKLEGIMKLCEHSKTILKEMEGDDLTEAQDTLNTHFTSDQFRQQFSWKHLPEFQWSFETKAQFCEDVNELLRALLKAVCEFLQRVHDEEGFVNLDELEYRPYNDVDDSSQKYDPYEDLQKFINLCRTRAEQRREGQGLDDWLLRPEVRRLLKVLKDCLDPEGLEALDKSDGAHKLLPVGEEPDDDLFEEHKIKVNESKFQHRPPSIYLGRYAGSYIPYFFDFDLCNMFLPGAVAFLEVLNLFLGKDSRESGVPVRLRGAGLVEILEEGQSEEDDYSSDS